LLVADRCDGKVRDMSALRRGEDLGH
jgi:hypothetical protein